MITTFKVLDMFYNEVLFYLPSIDEFRFIQSDNGQLDTNEVKRRIRIKHTLVSHPYLYFTNGFVERASM